MSFGRMVPVAVAVLLLGYAPQVAAETHPAAPLVGGFSNATITDTDVIDASAKAIKLLAGDSWLKTPDLTLKSILDAQRQVVAGQNFRLTLRVTSHGKHRVVRTLIYVDLQGKASISQLDLGPNDSAVTVPDPPQANAAPGGFRNRRPDDADVQLALTAVQGLLASSDWLSQPVLISATALARSQVVAGRNYFFEFRGTVGGQQRKFDLIAYTNLKKQTRLSWLRLSPI